MQHMSRWTSAVAAVCVITACSDSQLVTAPLALAAVAAEVVPTPCQAELDALRAAIAGAGFTGKNATTEQANLQLKVDAARAKLAEGKPADAIVKLEDIRATVVALSTPDAKGKTKLDAAGAAAIIAALDDTEPCIQPPEVTAAA